MVIVEGTHKQIMTILSEETLDTLLIKEVTIAAEYSLGHSLQKYIFRQDSEESKLENGKGSKLPYFEIFENKGVL